MNESSINKSNTFVIDIDGTLLKGQSQKYFISFLRKKGFVSFWAYLKITYWFALYKLHLASDSAKILSFALKGFVGRHVESVDSTIEEFMSEAIRPRYFKNSMELTGMLRAHGCEIVLLSSSVEIIVRAIARDFGIRDYICTKIETEKGIFTGRVEGSQVYGNQKVAELKEFLKNRGIPMSSVTIMADHSSDIPLLKSAGCSIVANPDRKMHMWAKENDMPVIYLDNNESVQYVESHIVS